jgi:hypothetical protein
MSRDHHANSNQEVVGPGRDGTPLSSGLFSKDPETTGFAKEARLRHADALVYINRAGKNLGAAPKKRLDPAKKLLQRGWKLRAKRLDRRKKRARAA